MLKCAVRPILSTDTHGLQPKLGACCIITIPRARFMWMTSPFLFLYRVTTSLVCWETCY